LGAYVGTPNALQCIGHFLHSRTHSEVISAIVSPKHKDVVQYLHVYTEYLVLTKYLRKGDKTVRIYKCSQYYRLCENYAVVFIK
jgi:hypothetical protein